MAEQLLKREHYIKQFTISDERYRAFLEARGKLLPAQICQMINRRKRFLNIMWG